MFSGNLVRMVSTWTTVLKNFLSAEYANNSRVSTVQSLRWEMFKPCISKELSNHIFSEPILYHHHHHHHHHHEHAPSWSVSDFHEVHQCSRSWVYFNAALKPRRSASRAALGLTFWVLWWCQVTNSSLLSQRPTYDEAGPLMTARFGEVRWSAARISTELGANESL